MVKGKKDFKGGLNSLIESTVIDDEKEDSPEVDVIAEAAEEIKPEPKKARKKVEKESAMTIIIPTSLKKTIKKYCVNNDITIKELFIKSVTDYMKEKKI